MRIKNGFKMRTLGQDHIVLAEGSKVVNFINPLYVNQSAAFLWGSVEGKDFSVEDLAQLLLDKYEISPELAVADAEKLVSSLKELGILEE